MPQRFILPEPIWADELVKKPKPDEYWIVPEYIERGDRLIVTGGEGEGKSTLLRQWAIMIASGINPFTGEEMQRQRVMLLDMENSEEQIKEELIKICERAGIDVPGEPWLVVVPWPAGIDLPNPDYEAAVKDALEKYPVDILIGGPLYKMADSSLADEEASKRTSSALDRIREAHDIALILEAHQINESVAFSTKANEFTRTRAPRPFGSSLWRRWPEFGFCLFTNGAVFRWRVGRRQRAWPPRFKRDGETWLWELDGRRCRCGKDLTARQITYCSDACSHAARQARYRQKGVTNLAE